MPVAYPIGLRSILKAGKSRTQAAAFSLAEPRRGYGYSQATGTDVPVFWDVSFLFDRIEAITFQMWFRDAINRGVDEFTMPIRTEFGLISHACRFLPDSLIPAQEQGGLFGYSATIMARAQVIPQAYQDASALIVGVPHWDVFGEMLDQAMTRELTPA